MPEERLMRDALYKYDNKLEYIPFSIIDALHF
jgi:hypothetical protein